jgi:hypothetical protein
VARGYYDVEPLASGEANISHIVPKREGPGPFRAEIEAYLESVARAGDGGRDQEKIFHGRGIICKKSSPIL